MILRPRGQIATFLLILMVGVLVFAMVTANLGRVATAATTVTNAADSSALSLGSQLGSQANRIWNDLGKKTEDEWRRTGFLGKLLAIIAAVVVVVVTWGSAAPLAFGLTGKLGIAVTAGLAGAAGGALGEGIAQRSFGWRGALGGAIQGFQIGMAIGFGAAQFGGAGVAKAGAQATVRMADGTLASGTLTSSATIGGQATVFAETVGVSGTLVSASMPLSLGAIGGGALGGSQTASHQTDDLGPLAKSMSGLGVADRIRESAFLEALSSTVEDPRKVQDLRDADGDGDTQEQVSYFLDWWDQRVEALKAKADQAAAGISGAIDQFTAGPLATFIDDVNGFLQEVARKEVEEADGRIVELTRALVEAKPTPYQVPFWEPGPSKAELEAWALDPDAKPPKGFDELDGVIHELGAFLQDAALIDSQGALKVQKPFVPYFPDFQDPLGPEERFVSRDLWIPLFYDPNSTTDYDDRLGVIAWGDTSQGVRGLTTWVKDLKDIRDKLRRCQLEWSTTLGTQFPNSVCKVYRVNPNNNSVLMTEVVAVEVEMNRLGQTVKAAIGTPSPPDGYTFVDGSLTITQIWVALKDSTLSYSYDYTYLGEKCTSATTTSSACVTSCTPSTTTTGTNPRTTTTVTCGICPSDPTKPLKSSRVVTETCERKQFSDSRAGEIPVQAPDLMVPQLSPTDFSAALSGFRDTLNSLGEKFATIDPDVADEFVPVLDALNGFTAKISEFRKALPTLPGVTAPVGAQSVRYTWPDTLGEHSVQVDMDAFKVPRAEVEKKGNFFVGKQRLVLKDPSDGGKPPCVTVTRRDPANKEMGGMGLWTWSPIEGSDVSVIKKKACVSYDVQKVELVGR